MNTQGRAMESAGSLGHPEFCTRPCLFHSSGACTNGQSCGFCHLEHLDPPAKMDQRQREKLLVPPRGRALQLALGMLRQKLLTIDAVAPHCWRSYARLCQACGAPDTDEDGPLKAFTRGERAVAKVMAAMNCRRLLILLRRTLLRGHPEAELAAEELEQQVLAALRPQ